jgi:hypothetical protein
MIHAFKNLGTQDIFDGKDSKAARKTCPSILSESGYPGFEDLQDVIERLFLRKWRFLEVGIF